MTSANPAAATDCSVKSNGAMGDGRHIAVLMASVVILVWGLITHGTFAGTGDEPHYLIAAHSVAFDGDLDVANNYREATLIADGTLLPEAHAIAHEGRLRPVHDVGMPLALAPAVRIAYLTADRLGDVLPPALLDRARLNKRLLLRHQLSLLMALLTACVAREVYLVIRGLGAGHRSAFGWALLCAMTPPVLSHSFLFFTEIPSALLATFAFRKLSLRAIDTAAVAALVGVTTGALLLVHARNVGLIIGLVVAAVAMARQRTLERKLLPVFLAGVAAGVVGRTIVTFELWGTFIQTPHAALRTGIPVPEIIREVFVRATGLLFDREYGLLAYAPIYCLAAPGLVVLFRHSASSIPRNAALVVLCYLLPVLLPVTNYHGWSGGWSPAARFLVPVAPLLWVAVYAFWAHGTRLGRVLATGLVATQVAIDLFVWQFPKTLWNEGDGSSAAPLARWLPTWFAGDATLLFAGALALFVAGALAVSKLTIRRTAAPATAT